MNQLYKLILLTIVFTAVSCSKKSVVTKTDTVVVYKDSISVKETIKYDTVKIPADTIQTTFTIECDSLTNLPKPFQVSQHNGRSSQTVTLNNKGYLVATCKTDSFIHIISALNKEIEVYKLLAIKKDNSTATNDIRYKIPNWVWYSLGLNILLTGWTFRKPIIKLIKLAAIPVGI